VLLTNVMLYWVTGAIKQRALFFRQTERKTKISAFRETPLTLLEVRTKIPTIMRPFVTLLGLVGTTLLCGGTADDTLRPGFGTDPHHPHERQLGLW
jgi:hypothetical protein